MSYKPQVLVGSEWATNGLAFATQEEAQQSADDLMSRWILVQDCGTVESDEVPNYELVNGELKAIGGAK